MSETKVQLIEESKVKPLQELSRIELSKQHERNESKYKAKSTEESNIAMEESHLVIEESLSVFEGSHKVLGDLSAKDETLLQIYGPKYKKPTSFVFKASAENREIHKDTFQCYFNLGKMGEIAKIAKKLRGGGQTEISEHTQEEFADPEDRRHFVRIVFMILSAMMLVTCSGVFCINHFLHELFREYGLYIVVGSSICLIGLGYIWGCIPGGSGGPCAYILLLLEVVFTILLCGAVTVRYKVIVVIIALACLVLLMLFCAILSCTKFDFTSFYLYIVMAMMVLCIAGMVLTFVRFVLRIHIPLVRLGLTVVGLLVQSIMFVIELQMIFGGKSMELNNTDYALGAYMLYTSIIQMFLHILRIVAHVDREHDF